MKNSSSLVKSCIEHACSEADDLMSVWHGGSEEGVTRFAMTHVVETLKSVHKVAGSCMTFGVDDVASIARVCEHVLKAVDLEKGSSKLISQHKIQEIKLLVKNLHEAAYAARKELSADAFDADDIEQSARLKISETVCAENTPDAHNAKCALLLIEDDPVMQSYVQSRLTQWGAYVKVAETGGEGYDFALREKFDLILLDGMLPDISGFEVLEKLRQHSEFTEKPILIFSALDDPEDVAEAQVLGATDYIMKPVDIDMLIDKISEHIPLEQA